MKKMLFFVFAIAIFGCNQESVSSSSGSEKAVVQSLDASGYEVTDMGNGYKMLTKKYANWKLAEQGITLNGKRNGAWVYYHSDREIPQSIANFVDDKYSGIYMEMDNRGQLLMIANYKDNELHGKFGRYKFGRTEEKGQYVNGKIDGKYVKYFKNSKKIQQETNYKNGVRDGSMKFFNEEGEVTLEYIYKNGKKVSGGK